MSHWQAHPWVFRDPPPRRCGWDPREGLECWLGFWKTPEASNSDRLGVELCVEPAGLCGRCTGVAVPLRVVPSP